MRLVTKNLNQSAYQQLANESTPLSSSEAKAKWKDFKHRSSLQIALLEDQHFLCCYTEVDANNEGWGYHIEHIENKSQNPQRTFDPTNLGASALTHHDLQKPSIKGNRFGGHAEKKAVSVDMALFIHCHQPDCFKFFAYLSNGHVVAANGLNAQEQSRVQYTIDLLNLNSKVLVLKRAQWYSELEEAYDKTSTSAMDIQQLVQYFKTPIENKLQSFYSMTQQFFSPIGTQT